MMLFKFVIVLGCDYLDYHLGLGLKGVSIPFAGPEKYFQAPTTRDMDNELRGWVLRGNRSGIAICLVFIRALSL